MKRHLWKLFLIPLGVVVWPLLPIWLWMILGALGMVSFLYRMGLRHMAKQMERKD